MRSVSEYVSDRGIGDDFKYIGVDSNSSDLYDFTPGDVVPINLEVPESQGQRDKDAERYNYLNTKNSIGEEGTDRRRSVARYFFDNHESYPDVKERLEEKIYDFYDSDRELNIWILHSLGGGTGSGMFPILISQLINIKDDLDANMNAIGSLPRLDNLEEDTSPPEKERYQANAYAALYELQKLLGTMDNDEGNTYPIELDLESGRFYEDEGITDDTVQIEKPPVDLYWLLGFDEERKGRSYRKAMNKIAAAGVVYYANQSSTENFPDDQSYDDNVFYALTSSSVEVPVDQAERYVNIGSEIAAAEDIIDALDDEITKHKETKAFLNEVHDVEVHPDRMDVSQLGLDHLKEDVITDCQLEVLNVDLYDVVEENIDLETNLGDLEDELQNDLRNPESVKPASEIRTIEKQGSSEKDGIRESKEEPQTVFNKKDIIAWLYCDQLAKILNKEANEHTFRAKVQQVWQHHTPEIEEECGHMSDAEPEKQWQNALDDYLNNKWYQLDDDIEDTSSFRQLRKRRLKQERSTVGDQIQAIGNQYDDFKKLEKFIDKVESRRDTARKAIDNSFEELKDQIIANKESQRSDVHQRKEKKEAKKNSLENTLKNPEESSGEFTRYIGLNKPDSLSTDDLSASSSIADLIDDQTVRESNVASTISSSLGKDLGDPVHDDTTRIDGGRASIDEIHGVAINEENQTPPDSLDVPDLLKLELRGDTDIPTLLDSVDYYEEEMIVDDNDGFSIRFFKWFTPIQFEGTSEFGVIHEWFTNPDRDISDQFTDFYDEDVLDRFAYPDLFTENDPGGERIKEHFSLSEGKKKLTD